MSAVKTDDQKLQQILLQNVHTVVEPPGSGASVVQGDYLFYHYGLENLDDRGWGCGYRTLQSLCSWVRNQLSLKALAQPQDREPAQTQNREPAKVPRIPEIQHALVAMGDKEDSFKGSKTWIGSFEVCLCLDHFYDVPCKILHLRSGRELCSHVEELEKHFRTFGSPLMMGGDKDSASKGILGVCAQPAALLVMDPHYYSKDGTAPVEVLVDQGFIKWKLLEEFEMDSFYNLCLPQLKAQQLK